MGSVGTNTTHSGHVLSSNVQLYCWLPKPRPICTNFVSILSQKTAMETLPNPRAEPAFRKGGGLFFWSVISQLSISALLFEANRARGRVVAPWSIAPLLRSRTFLADIGSATETARVARQLPQAYCRRCDSRSRACPAPHRPQPVCYCHRSVRRERPTTHLFWPVRRFRGFVQQLLTVMPNEEHFLFGERTMSGYASEQMFTRITEGRYVIC